MLVSFKAILKKKNVAFTTIAPSASLVLPRNVKKTLIKPFGF